MKRLIVTLLLLGAPTLTYAQERVDSAMFRRIRDEGMQHSRAFEAFTLLNDRFGPRLTASPAFKASVEWARDQLQQWGMSNSHLEPFQFGHGWTLEKLVLEMTSPRYFPLIGYPEAWTPPTNGVVTGTPIYIGDKTAEEINAMAPQLRGAIVLLQPARTEFIRADRPEPSLSETRVAIGAPATPRNDAKAQLRDVLPILQRAGAAAVLRPSPGEHGTIFVTGRVDTPADATPSIVLAAEHYNQLVRMVQSGSPMNMRVELVTRFYEADRNAYNVIAEIPGADPQLRNEVILLGAHIDSWHSATGATDNADAVSSAMEAMRILHAVGARPRRTIRVALWGGEEQGLLGSQAYVAQHIKNAAGPHENIVLYLNDDPGKGPTYGFYMQEDSATKKEFDAWLAPFKDLGARRNVIDKIGNTDHLSFIAAGIPGFNTLKGYHEYDVREHHTNTDFFERVNDADLKQSAIVLASFAWQAANRPAARLTP